MGWGIIVFAILELIGIALIVTFVWAYEKAKRTGTEVEKWAWAVLALGILLMLGAIVFLFVGRKHKPVHSPAVVAKPVVAKPATPARASPAYSYRDVPGLYRASSGELQMDPFGAPTP